jgi:hypothetical protein
MNKLANKIVAVLIIASVLMVFACSKNKPEKLIIGKWAVLEKYSETTNFIDNKVSGIYYTTSCDSLPMQRRTLSEIYIAFNTNEIFSEEIKQTISYLDTAATRINCTPIYKDSIVTDTIKGAWKIDGSTLAMVVGTDYTGHKLLEINKTNMSWETNVAVVNSIVTFNGTISTKFKKM